MPELAPHIESTPGVCGGRPRIAGHRIRVQDIAILHESFGLSADEIRQHYPQLSLSQIFAALSFYFDHRDEIQREIAEAETLVEEMKRLYPSVLQQRLKNAD